jgi:hypothetical protein
MIMEPEIRQLKEKVKHDILTILKSYTHGVPTYNDTFKRQILGVIETNFNTFSDEYEILLERESKRSAL